jgi:hypothetical protein
VTSPRPDLCAAKKGRILINHQPRRFDVTMERATRLELAAFSHENIALHRPSHLHRFRPDLTAYACVLSDRERSGGIDCALHLAVDEQLIEEFDRAFDRNSSGEKSAGLRWHERAVGRRWGDRWFGRFVCGGCGFGLSSEDVHSVIPAGLVRSFLLPDRDVAIFGRALNHFISLLRSLRREVSALV